MPLQAPLFLPVVSDPVGEPGLVPIRAQVLTCEKCVLFKTRGDHYVFGEGNPNAPDVCFVGEGPGLHESVQGRPFVGRSGQFLDRMIAAMGYSRDQVYVTNAVKCRPPENRVPEKDEIKACGDYLEAEIRAVRPKILVALGATGLVSLVGGRPKIADKRGKWLEYKGIPMMPTFHPSAVARAEKEANFTELKKMVWADLQSVMNKIEQLRLP